MLYEVITQAGSKVLQFELGLQAVDLQHVSRWFAADDFTAPPASGSAHYDAMVVLPCTVGSLAAIAGGFCGNLLHRAADVTLKERRPLVITSYSIHYTKLYELSVA